MVFFLYILIMIVYNFEEYCENEKVNWTNVALGFSIVLYLVSHYGIPKSAAISYVNTQIENSKVVNVDTVSEMLSSIVILLVAGLG